MFLKEVSIRNYRSILKATLACDRLTALVGSNGSGKSSFLSAIKLFYNPSAKVTADDFYGGNTEEDIEISLTFTSLTRGARERFAPYLEDETLTVSRLIPDPRSNRSEAYHGMRQQHSGFVDIRSAPSASDKIRRYREKRTEEKYVDLPTANSAVAVDKFLANWENKNPQECRLLRDDGQFFGYRHVGHGYLKRYTQCIHVPAVREATDDATDRKGSVVTELMDVVVRRVLANRPEVVEFRDRVQEEYRELLTPGRLPQLVTLQDDLSEILRSYVPDAGIDLQWSSLSEIEIPMPQAEVRLLEDNYVSKVEAAGHGLQRALIITMLQHLHTVREVETALADNESVEPGAVAESSPSERANLILAIEEPELYQHPSRQRHLASVLMKLTAGGTSHVAGNVQIIYTTHSPLFVGLDRFNQIRVLRKTSQVEGQPKVTSLKNAELDSVAGELEAAQRGRKSEFTGETLRARLQAVMTPWTNEGFFAEVVVLVEGETDLAAIVGVARSMGHELDSFGVSVIPCSGKTTLDRPLVIFRQLDIPVYVIWDGDWEEADANAEDNRIILRHLQLPEEDWPGFVGDRAACFRSNLERTLIEELGKNDFDRYLAEAKKHYSIARRDRALKNPTVIQRVMEMANAEDNSSPSLKSIVDKILVLRQQMDSAP
jgi:predicted ATP-dependent endonuclease of OLD family